MKIKFNKDIFLKESKELFLEIFMNSYNSNYILDFTDVLGKVIEVYFRKYEVDDVINNISYNKIDLQNWYEFDEEDFSNYFDDCSIIKNYREALSYYSLNHLFLENHEEELDKIINNLD